MLMREYYGHDRAGEAMAGKGSPQTLAKVIAMRAQDSDALRLHVLGRDGGAASVTEKRFSSVASATACRIRSVPR